MFFNDHPAHRRLYGIEFILGDLANAMSGD
jgi:hypothetical protein